MVESLRFFTGLALGAFIVYFLMTSYAPAQGVGVHCSRGQRGEITCMAATLGSSSAKIFHRQEFDEERDRKWVEFCKPRIVEEPPHYVRTYKYAHPGCEYGRTQ